jgi:hypothetical protein
VTVVPVRERSAHGVSGEMLSTKAERDSSVASKTKARLEGVSSRAKVRAGCVSGQCAELGNAVLCVPLRNETDPLSAVSLVPVVCDVAGIRFVRRCHLLIPQREGDGRPDGFPREAFGEGGCSSPRVLTQ